MKVNRIEVYKAEDNTLHNTLQACCEHNLEQALLKIKESVASCAFAAEIARQLLTDSPFVHMTFDAQTLLLREAVKED